MRRRIVHQWRDWLLEYVGEDTYELSHKDNLALHRIVAKDAMDAEHQSQKIIRDFKNEAV